MALFFAALPAGAALGGFTGDAVIEGTPTGSTHNSFGDFAASGQAVRILIDTAQLPNAGDAQVAIHRLAANLLDLSPGPWQPPDQN